MVPRMGIDQDHHLAQVLQPPHEVLEEQLSQSPPKSHLTSPPYYFCISFVLALIHILNLLYLLSSPNWDINSINTHCIPLCHLRCCHTECNSEVCFHAHYPLLTCREKASDWHTWVLVALSVTKTIKYVIYIGKITIWINRLRILDAPENYIKRAWKTLIVEYIDGNHFSCLHVL